MVVSRRSTALNKTTDETVTASSVFADTMRVDGSVDVHRLAVDANVTLPAPSVLVEGALRSSTPLEVGTVTLGERTGSQFVNALEVGYGLEPKGKQDVARNLGHVRHERLGFEGNAQRRVGRLGPTRVVRWSEVDDGGHVRVRLRDQGLDRFFVRSQDLETRRPGRTARPSPENATTIVEWLTSVVDETRRRWWTRTDLGAPYEVLELEGVTGAASGLVRMQDDRIAVVPANEDVVAAFDARTGETSIVDLDPVVLDAVSGSTRFRGGTLLTSGEIAFTPFELDLPVVWDPYTNVFTVFEASGLVGGLDGALAVGSENAFPILCLSLRRQLGSYRGPTVRVERQSTPSVQADLYFDDRGTLFRIQRVGQSQAEGTADLNAWADGRQMRVIRWYDQSGNGYHAEVEGTVPLVVESGSGPFSCFLDFQSGTSQSSGVVPGNRLVVPHDPAFDLADRITVACMHRPTTWGPEARTHVVGRGNRIVLHRRGATSGVRFTVRGPDQTEGDVFDPDTVSISASLGADLMYHVGTYDADPDVGGALYGYKSNASNAPNRTAASNGSGSMSTEPAAWTVGDHGGEDDLDPRPYHGRIYDVQIYARAISQTEATAIWNTVRAFT